MGRFRNARNGVIVDVDEVTAENLGAAYEPVDEVSKAPAKKAAAPKSDSK